MERDALRASWYDRGQLLRRMADEVYRSRRHQVEFSIILLAFTRQGHLEVETVPKKAFRQTDFGGMLSESHCLFGLPHTGPAGALTVCEHLAVTLFDFAPLIGMATSPDQGKTVFALLSAAKQNQSVPSGRAATVRSTGAIGRTEHKDQRRTPA